MSASLAPAPAAPEIAGPPTAAPAGRRVGRDILAVAAITVLLLLPAIFNGYPVLFPDTAEYLLRAATLTPSPIRAPGYGVWIWATSGGVSLWLPVVAQSALLAALIWRTLLALARPTLPAALLTVLALVLGTSLGWVSSKAMPDVFIGTVVLGLYLAIFHWRALGGAGRLLACVGIVVGGTMHLTNVVIGALLVATIALLQLTRSTRRDVAIACGRGAALLLVALGLTRIFDVARRDDHQRPFNGSVFVLGHLVETGLAQRLLVDRCGAEQFALCAVRDTLTRPIEIFVWRPKESPRWFVLGDDPTVISGEASHVLRGVVTHYPFATLASLARYTGEQLVTFRVNDDIWRHRQRAEVQRFIVATFPGDLPMQSRARQQENTLRLPWTTPLHLVVFFGAAAMSLIALRRVAAARAFTRDGTLGFQAIVWATLVLNAAVCANLSSVFSRYQSRVSWLLPFAVLMTWLEQREVAR